MASADTADAVEHGHDEHHDHVLSPQVLIGTWLGLMVLTGATVGATLVDFGAQANLVIAMLIAVAKALLVAFIFMHLWFDKKLNLMIFFGSILFVVLFISIAFIDVSRYQEGVEALEADQAAEAAGEPAMPDPAASVKAPTVVDDGNLRVKTEGGPKLPVAGPTSPRVSPTAH